jgi:FMN-dependent NADH-azoreductase
MPKTLLEIDSSPLGERSISRHLTHEFVQNWKQANPSGHVVTRDLNATTIRPIDAAWIAASYTAEDKLTPEQRSLLSLSENLIDELKQADEYVIGVPMHNFSIPSVLKLWIDQVARVNKTFSYATGKPEGLLNGKKATVFITSGGKYDAGTAMASWNFVEPYAGLPRRHGRDLYYRWRSLRSRLRQGRPPKLPRFARAIHPRPIPACLMSSFPTSKEIHP